MENIFRKKCWYPEPTSWFYELSQGCPIHDPMTEAYCMEKIFCWLNINLFCNNHAKGGSKKSFDDNKFIIMSDFLYEKIGILPIILKKHLRACPIIDIIFWNKGSADSSHRGVIIVFVLFFGEQKILLT